MLFPILPGLGQETWASLVRGFSAGFRGVWGGGGLREGGGLGNRAFSTEGGISAGGGRLEAVLHHRHLPTARAPAIYTERAETLVR